MAKKVFGAAEKLAAKLRLELVDKKKLVKAAYKKLDEFNKTIPETFQAFSPAIRKFKEQVAEEEAAIKKLGKQILDLAKKSGGKAVVGTAAAGTAAALSEGEAEAGKFDPFGEAFKRMWRANLKGLGDDDLIKFGRKHIDEEEAIRRRLADTEQPPSNVEELKDQKEVHTAKRFEAQKELRERGLPDDLLPLPKRKTDADRAAAEAKIESERKIYSEQSAADRRAKFHTVEAGATTNAERIGPQRKSPGGLANLGDSRLIQLEDEAARDAANTKFGPLAHQAAVERHDRLLDEMKRRGLLQKLSDVEADKARGQFRVANEHDAQTATVAQYIDELKRNGEWPNFIKGEAPDHYTALEVDGLKDDELRAWVKRTRDIWAETADEADVRALEERMDMGMRELDRRRIPLEAPGDEIPEPPKPWGPRGIAAGGAALGTAAASQLAAPEEAEAASQFKPVAEASEAALAKLRQRLGQAKAMEWKIEQEYGAHDILHEPTRLKRNEYSRKADELRRQIVAMSEKLGKPLAVGGTAAASQLAAPEEAEAGPLTNVLKRLSPAIERTKKDVKWHGTADVFEGPFDDKKQMTGSLRGPMHYFTESPEAASEVATNYAWRTGDRAAVIPARLKTGRILDVENYDTDFVTMLASKAPPGSFFRKLVLQARNNEQAIDNLRTAFANYGKKIKTDDYRALDQEAGESIKKALEESGYDTITGRLAWPFYDPDKAHREWAVAHADQIKRGFTVGGVALGSSAIANEAQAQADIPATPPPVAQGMPSLLDISAAMGGGVGGGVTGGSTPTGRWAPEGRSLFPPPLPGMIPQEDIKIEEEYTRPGSVLGRRGGKGLLGTESSFEAFKHPIEVAKTMWGAGPLIGSALGTIAKNKELAGAALVAEAVTTPFDLLDLASLPVSMSISMATGKPLVTQPSKALPWYLGGGATEVRDALWEQLSDKAKNSETGQTLRDWMIPAIQWGAPDVGIVGGIGKAAGALAKGGGLKGLGRAVVPGMVLTAQGERLIAQHGMTPNQRMKANMQATPELIASLPDAPASYGQTVGPAPQKVFGVLDSGRRVINRMRDNLFAQPGTRRDIAQNIKDKDTKNFLIRGLPEIERKFGAVHDYVMTGFKMKYRDLYSAMKQATGGDSELMEKMAAKLDQARRVGHAVVKTLPPAVADALKSTMKWQKDIVDEIVRAGNLTVAEAKALTDSFYPKSFRAYQASRYGDAYLAKVTGQPEWYDLFNFMQKQNPNATAQEITGEMEDLLQDEVVRHFVEKGDFTGEFMRRNPMFGTAVETSNPKKIDKLIRKFYGEINDYPTGYELAGRTIARVAATQTVGKRLIDTMAKHGLADYKAMGGMDPLPPSMTPGRQNVWVVRELKDSVEFTKRVDEELKGLMLKAGAAFRYGKTVGSATTSMIMNPLSNFSVLYNSGLGMDRNFWFYDLPRAVGHTFDTLVHGVPSGRRDVELGYSRLGTTGGVFAHATEQYSKDSGFMTKLFDEMGQYSPVTRFVKAGPRLLARMFNETDLLFKRAVMPRMVAQYDSIIKNLGPSDRQLLKLEYGSDDPVEIVNRIIGDDFQSYNRTPKFWQDIGRKSSIVGLFATFAAEMTRNAGKSYNHLAKDLKIAMLAEDPKLRNYSLNRSIQRGVGMMTALYMFDSLKEILDARQGPVLTEKQEEVFARRGVPEWDRGKLVVHSRTYDPETRDMIVKYTPLARYGYFNKLHEGIDYALSLATSIASGRFDQVPKQAFDLMAEISGTFFPLQEPLGLMIESGLNVKLQDDSILKTATDFASGIPLKPLIIDPREDVRREKRVEHFAKGMRPTLVGQVASLVSGVPWRQVFPLGQERESNVTIKMRQEAAVLEKVKNTYAAALGRIGRDDTMPLEDKAKEVAELKKDFETDLAPELKSFVLDWATTFSEDDIFIELGPRLGKRVVGSIYEGQPLDFYMVFSDSIPPDLRF